MRAGAWELDHRQMPTVTVSAQIVVFPSVCVCCGAPQPAGAIRVVATRHQAGDWLRKKDQQLVLPFPACVRCAAHAHGQPRTPYCAPGAAVVYRGWRGTQHTFEFTGPAYAAAFLHANQTAGKKAWGDVASAPYPGPAFAGGAWPAPVQAVPAPPVHVPVPPTRLGPVAIVFIAAVAVCCLVGIVAANRNPRRPPAPSSAPVAAPILDAAAQTLDAGGPARHHHPPRRPR